MTEGRGTLAVIILSMNAVYIPLIEEPLLAQRFGAAYQNYGRQVPRLPPRLHPWKG
jgi:protein-S-isoprenylcysteine O-methyltransferase Ste14